MKKFIRLLFSGYIFIFLALIVELGVLIFFQVAFDDVVLGILKIFNVDTTAGWIAYLASGTGYVLVKGISFLVAFIIFLRIVNKEEDPEFKIPWIVAMVIFPFLTSVIYLIFGNHGLRKRYRIIMQGSLNSYNYHFKLNEEKKNEYEEELGEAVGSFKYIFNTTHLGVHKNNRVTYYKNGESFFPEFIEGLKKAKEFIFMEFFIISDGKEWDEVRQILIDKAKEGVDVRIIYDDMGCTGTISSFTPKRLAKYGIKCYKFHPFRPILSGVFNNRDHRKIVIIDHQMAFTGGINLADEYANEIKRFGYWKDTMVKIEGSAINNLLTIFLQNYNLCTFTISDYNMYLMHDYEKFDDEGFVMPFGDGPGGYDNALIGEQNYINILNYAKRKVYISTPYLIPTYQLIDAMRNAALRGVEVNLIVPGIPDKKIVYMIAKRNFHYLLEAGVNIYTYTPGFNHMKSAMADDELAFVGTINFDFRSLVHHFECGTLLYKCNCMNEIRDDFIEMMEASKKVDKNYRQFFLLRWFCSILKLITPLL